MGRFQLTQSRHPKHIGTVISALTSTLAPSHGFKHLPGYPVGTLLSAAGILGSPKEAMWKSGPVHKTPKPQRVRAFAVMEEIGKMAPKAKYQHTCQRHPESLST